MVRRHAYSYPKADGTKDARLEKAYERLDTDASRLFSKVIAATNQDKTPNLDKKDLAIWAHYFFHQFARVPAFFDQVATQMKLRENIEADIEKIENERGPIPAEKKAAFLSEDGKDRFIQSVKIRAITADRQSVLSDIAVHGIRIVRIVEDKCSFVLGDHPIARIEPKDLPQRSFVLVGTWLPLTPKIAVGPGESLEVRSMDVSGLRDPIRRFNERVFSQSYEIVSHSEPLLRSLSRTFSKITRNQSI